MGADIFGTLRNGDVDVSSPGTFTTGSVRHLRLRMLATRNCCNVFRMKIIPLTFDVKVVYCEVISWELMLIPNNNIG